MSVIGLHRLIESKCAQCARLSTLVLCASCLAELKPLLDAATDLARFVYDDQSADVALEQDSADGDAKFGAAVYTSHATPRRTIPRNSVRAAGHGPTPRDAYCDLIDALLQDGDSLVTCVGNAITEARCLRSRHLSAPSTVVRAVDEIIAKARSLAPVAARGLSMLVAVEVPDTFKGLLALPSDHIEVTLSVRELETGREGARHWAWYVTDAERARLEQFVAKAVER